MSDHYVQQSDLLCHVGVVQITCVNLATDIRTPWQVQITPNRPASVKLSSPPAIVVGKFCGRVECLGLLDTLVMISCQIATCIPCTPDDRYGEEFQDT